MNSVFTTIIAVLFVSIVNAQYNTPWTINTPNTSQSGYVGIGTKSTSGITNTPLPNFNLHLHGTSDYIYDDGSSSGIMQSDSIGTEFLYQTKSITNYGKTARIGMTNTVTGMTEGDGVVFRLSNENFYIQNREIGVYQMSARSLSFTLSGVTNRAYLGLAGTSESEYARLNIFGNTDNGIYIRTSSSGKYGLSIRTNTSNDIALRVMGTDGVTSQFSVNGNGHTEIFTSSTIGTDKVFLIRNSDKKLFQITNDGILRTREIYVDALNWADYVFSPDYDLMTLSELETFIETNHHLPNIPSANDITMNGVNVAQTDALLLEKIEEMTLYILQQQKQLDAMQEEINSLKILKPTN